MGKKGDGPRWVNVYSVGYTRWPAKAKGKPDTIRCDFTTDDREAPYSMWLALDHPGLPHRMAMIYVRACGGSATTVDEAMEEQYDWRDPIRIRIERDKKNPEFFRITAFEFADDKETTLDDFSTDEV